MSQSDSIDRRTTLGALAMAAVAGSMRADEPKKLEVLSPVENRVYQRRGYRPTAGRFDERHSDDFGAAKVPLRLKLDPATRFVATKIERAPDQFGPELKSQSLIDVPSAPFDTTIDVPAGGWFSLSVEALDADKKSLGVAKVERFGVGEVFLIGGQSYAGNHNDEKLKIADPHERATACDLTNDSWRVAHDPQPTTTGDQGSVWPALADLLLPTAQVPIGFVNVSVGATSSRQWSPGEALFDRLLAGAKAAGDFRAVLWQQGESDVIEKTATDVYVERYEKIRAEFVKRTGRDVPWLLAKSTLHPTVYDDPVHEVAVRMGTDKLWKSPGFLPGPDTDVLAGENRGPLGTQRHWTGVGQRRAAALWFASVWNLLSREESTDAK